MTLGLPPSTPKKARIDVSDILRSLSGELEGISALAGRLEVVVAGILSEMPGGGSPERIQDFDLMIQSIGEVKSVLELLGSCSDRNFVTLDEVEAVLKLRDFYFRISGVSHQDSLVFSGDVDLF